MAELIRSDYAKGILVPPTPGVAGTVAAYRAEITLTEEQVASGNIVELAVLPAGATLVDAILFAEELDADSDSPTGTVDVGLMSGAVGEDDATRTCGDQLFDGDDLIQSGGAKPLASGVAFSIAPSDQHRSIGVKFASAIAEAAGGKLGLAIFYTV